MDALAGGTLKPIQDFVDDKMNVEAAYNAIKDIEGVDDSKTDLSGMRDVIATILDKAQKNKTKTQVMLMLFKPNPPGQQTGVNKKGEVNPSVVPSKPLKVEYVKTPATTGQAQGDPKPPNPAVETPDEDAGNGSNDDESDNEGSDDEGSDNDESPVNVEEKTAVFEAGVLKGKLDKASTELGKAKANGAKLKECLETLKEVKGKVEALKAAKKEFEEKKTAMAKSGKVDPTELKKYKDTFRLFQELARGNIKGVDDDTGDRIIDVLEEIQGGTFKSSS